MPNIGLSPNRSRFPGHHVPEYLRFLVPKTILPICIETRDLKSRVLGPSGCSRSRRSGLLLQTPRGTECSRAIPRTLPCLRISFPPYPRLLSCRIFFIAFASRRVKLDRVEVNFSTFLRPAALEGLLKPSTKEQSLNHIRVLMYNLGIFLNEKLLEDSVFNRPE